MRYRVEFTASAVREFKALERSVQRRIATRINQLAENPFPPDVKKLHGAADHYRIRAGEYRVIYRVEGRRVAVVVVKIGHRRDVYR
jgi:mRNA interferase RelE/StbE